MNTQFPNLTMLYADHVIRGLRKLESVPAMFYDDVVWLIEDLKKKNPEKELEV